MYIVTNRRHQATSRFGDTPSLARSVPPSRCGTTFGRNYSPSTSLHAVLSMISCCPTSKVRSESMVDNISQSTGIRKLKLSFSVRGQGILGLPSLDMVLLFFDPTVQYGPTPRIGKRCSSLCEGMTTCSRSWQIRRGGTPPIPPLTFPTQTSTSCGQSMRRDSGYGRCHPGE
ncbi:hypothetical protein OG21DRAFT_849549 [Imleria badia]|nr:hypothetical protein OG21DRAFT_849549 [Imleria badia]